MSEKGRDRVWSLVTIFFPFTLLVAVAVFSGGDVTAEDRGDPTPPTSGDWYVNATTRIEGGDVTVTGNIIVGRGATLTLKDTLLTVNSSHPAQFKFLVKAGATLVVNGSTLRLDFFESEKQAALLFSGGSLVTARGQFLSRSQSTFLTDTEVRNRAPDGAPNMPGGDALLILDGKVNSEAVNVTILNQGGDAGITDPAQNGSRGGRAVLISNITSWKGARIVCKAGRSRGGGLGLEGLSGGNGAPGADATVLLTTTEMDTVEVEVTASDGAIGARGARATEGDGGDGGHGGDGGLATLQITCRDVLVVTDCEMVCRSGNGGSGGNGGEAINGSGGAGGISGMAGDADVAFSCGGDIHLTRTTIRCLAGEGGYGGDYGRHEAGTGTFGVPSAGGNGGNARVEMTSPWDLYVNDLTIDSRGGAGLDGGGGYEQGERGGNGGDGIIWVVVNGSLEATAVDLQALGGDGGPGGPAYSDINGAGGDGGDALIEFTGLATMDVGDFSMLVTAGEGGLGDKPIFDGSPGGEQFDLDTERLWMGNGTLNMPLDDLHGDAVGYLYRVTFDMDFGIHVLPIGNAVVYESYLVTVTVTDEPDPSKASPLEGHEVIVYDKETGALVASALTDADGRCYFHLLAFEYTSSQVIYRGSYYFVIESPDGTTTKKVRGDVQGPTQITVPFYEPCLFVNIMILDPEDGKEYRLYPSKGEYLETHGYFILETRINGVTVQLRPEGESSDAWPVYKLGQSPIPHEDLLDDNLSWGKYFPPNTHSNQWLFFYRFPMASDVEYYNGAWILEVVAERVDDKYMSSVTIDLLLDENLERPWVRLLTEVNGATFNGSIVTVEGSAGDDYQVSIVEARLDSGEWFVVGISEIWNMTIDTRSLGEGTHHLDLRAFDGLDYSDLSTSTFEVRFNEEPPDDDDGGGQGIDWNTRTILMASGGLLMVIALALLVAVYVVRRRSHPDN